MKSIWPCSVIESSIQLQFKPVLLQPNRLSKRSTSQSQASSLFSWFEFYSGQILPSLKYLLIETRKEEEGLFKVSLRTSQGPNSISLHSHSVFLAKTSATNRTLQRNLHELDDRSVIFELVQRPTITSWNASFIDSFCSLGRFSLSKEVRSCWFASCGFGQTAPRSELHHGRKKPWDRWTGSKTSDSDNFSFNSNYLTIE